MKKILLIIIPALFLTACFEGKEHFEKAVLLQMKNEQDIKDYNLDPERMTQCVVDVTGSKMPGVFAYDPNRDQYYDAYAKMLELKTAKDPQAVLKELRDLFGSGQAVAKAHLNYSDSMFQCLTSLVSETEEDQKEAEVELADKNT